MVGDKIHKLKEFKTCLQFEFVIVMKAPASCE